MTRHLKILYVFALVFIAGAFALPAMASCNIDPTTGSTWDDTTFTYSHTDSILVYRDTTFVNVLICSSPFTEDSPCGGPIKDWATTDGLYTYIGSGASWSTTEAHCGGSHTPTECENNLTGASIVYDSCTRQLGTAPTPTPTPTPTSSPTPTTTPTPTSTISATSIEITEIDQLRADIGYYYWITLFLLIFVCFFIATSKA